MKNRDWTGMLSKLGFVIGLAVAAIWIAQAGGCQAIRDTTARIIGAPTSADVAVAAQAQTEAEEQVAAADTKIEQLAAAIADVEEDAAAIEDRKQTIRATYAEAAAKLPDLVGAAADQMIAILNDLAEQLTSAEEDAQVIGAMIASFQASVAEYRASATAAREEAEANRLYLEGVDEMTAAAIAGATSTIRLTGDTATGLGIPGAGAAGNLVANSLGGILSLILGGSTIASVASTKRQRRRADDEHKRRGIAEKIIVTTEKLGLIRSDADAKEVKEVARKELGDEAIEALHIITAGVQ